MGSLNKDFSVFNGLDCVTDILSDTRCDFLVFICSKDSLLNRYSKALNIFANISTLNTNLIPIPVHFGAQAARGSFRLVESELIDKLDLLISENKGDDEYRELFSTM